MSPDEQSDSSIENNNTTRLRVLPSPRRRRKVKKKTRLSWRPEDDSSQDEWKQNPFPAAEKKDTSRIEFLSPLLDLSSIDMGDTTFNYTTRAMTDLAEDDLAEETINTQVPIPFPFPKDKLQQAIDISRDQIIEKIDQQTEQLSCHIDVQQKAIESAVAELKFNQDEYTLPLPHPCACGISTLRDEQQLQQLEDGYLRQNHSADSQPTSTIYEDIGIRIPSPCQSHVSDAMIKLDELNQCEPSPRPLSQSNEQEPVLEALGTIMELLLENRAATAADDSLSQHSDMISNTTTDTSDTASDESIPMLVGEYIESSCQTMQEEDKKIYLQSTDTQTEATSTIDQEIQVADVIERISIGIQFETSVDISNTYTQTEEKTSVDTGVQTKEREGIEVSTQTNPCTAPEVVEIHVPARQQRRTAPRLLDETETVVYPVDELTITTGDSDKLKGSSSDSDIPVGSFTFSLARGESAAEIMERIHANVLERVKLNKTKPE